MAGVRFSQANVAIVLVALLGAIASAPLAADAAAARSQPGIKWTENRYKLTAEPGGSVQMSASFTSRHGASDLSIDVSRSLAAFVVVTPANIPEIPAGASALIKLTARVPLDTPAGRYTGQLFVRKAGVVAKTKLTVVVPSVRYLYMARGEFGSNYFARSFVWGGTYDPQFVASQYDRVFELAATKDYVFWARLGENTIGRANRDGTNVIHDFITAPVGSFIFVLAASSTQIYWAAREEGFGPEGRIGRANLDGTNVNSDFMNVPNIWTGLAVTNSYIFYNDDTPAIKRANLDGTNAQVFIAGVESPQFAAHGDLFYWLNPFNEPNDSIGRVKENGANLDPDFLPISTSYPVGMAVDSKFIYWSTYESSDQRAVFRAALDGSTGAIELFLNAGGAGIAVEPD